VAAISAATAAINTPETTVVSYTVPANTIAIGTTYCVVAYGTCTTTAANPQQPEDSLWLHGNIVGYFVG
jgi:hypothetical protein